MELKRKKTEAQLKAQKNWESKNREQSNYLKYKSSTKTFIKKATKEDLIEVIELANKKLLEFNK